MTRQPLAPPTLSRSFGPRSGLLWLTALLVTGTIALMPSCALERMGSAPTESALGGTGGAPQACTAPTQCPGSDATCRVRTCDDGVCGFWYAEQRTECTEQDGKLCDRGVCVQCLEPTDCTNDYACADGRCVPVQCADGIKNGDETAVDCGGDVCPPCAIGQPCLLGSDCQSGVCAGGVCAPCTSHTQCPADHFCDAAGTGLCIAKRVDGESCAEPDECVTGFCPDQDGVCCNAACDAGLCLACAGTKTGGAAGVCAAVTAGADYDEECADAPPCGSTGACNGNPGAPDCAYYAAGLPCGSAQSCSGSTQTNQDTCSGSGSCTDQGTTDCDPHVCDAAGTACRTDCTTHADCAADHWCDAAADPDDCAADKAVGSTCGASQECINNQNCYDGYCCNSACGGACLNCSSTPGTCAGNTCTCDEQYSHTGYQACSPATAAECKFYTSMSASTSCAAFCRNRGGECLRAYNDGNNHCDQGDDITCTTTSYGTRICICSAGCGSGARCPPGRSCSSGNCS